MSNSTAEQLLATLNLKENITIGKMEQYYLRNKRPLIYVALEEVEDAEFFWSPVEIKLFTRMWKMGMKLEDIAKELHRSEIAVFLLSLDRIFQGKIKPRDWKIW
jgi:adenylate cyclase class IV